MTTTFISDREYYYLKTSKFAVNVFGQNNQSLYGNHPRLTFEYYVKINLRNFGETGAFIQSFLSSLDMVQISPLIKAIDMPSMKIDTFIANQYNRNRITQHKIKYDPIKMVIHDVVDGKTLKFWDMYYRYYYGDGNEFGKNDKPNNRNNLYPTTIAGDKSNNTPVISDELTNHVFGYNLPMIGIEKDLIESIEIVQVHGGRYNKVVLVNPRISAFSNGTLSYEDTAKTVELTFTLEYEYVYYEIKNEVIDGNELENYLSYGDALDISIGSITAPSDTQPYEDIAGDMNWPGVPSVIPPIIPPYMTKEPSVSDLKRLSTSVLGSNLSQVVNVSTVPGGTSIASSVPMDFIQKATGIPIDISAGIKVNIVNGKVSASGGISAGTSSSVNFGNGILGNFGGTIGIGPNGVTGTVGGNVDLGNGGVIGGGIGIGPGGTVGSIGGQIGGITGGLVVGPHGVNATAASNINFSTGNVFGNVGGRINIGPSGSVSANVGATAAIASSIGYSTRLYGGMGIGTRGTYISSARDRYPSSGRYPTGSSASISGGISYGRGGIVGGVSIAGSSSGPNGSVSGGITVSSSGNGINIGASGGISARF